LNHALLSLNMDTDTLRWFQLAADGMTLTEVAGIHAASQPGVSRALSRLEAEVGTPLLQKNGRVLRVTHAGSVFKRHVDGLLHRLDDGLAAVNELVDPETGTVTVAFQTTLGTWLVPGHIGQFRQQHPRVQFRLVHSDDAQGSSLVAGGRIDLEFTARRPRNPAVHWERLFAQPLALAVPAQHGAAVRSQISLSEVADSDFVMLGPSWTLRGLTDELCRQAGFAPRVAFEADDLSVVRGLVAAGLGVAVVPRAGLDESAERPGGERLIRLTDPGASRDVGLAWSTERHMLPSAELFRKHVVTMSGTAPPTGG